MLSRRAVTAGLALAGTGLGVPARAAGRAARPDYAAVLKAHGITGCFVQAGLRDAGLGPMNFADEARARRRFIPASTFKIVNSLIALETGVVTDVDAVFPVAHKTPPRRPEWVPPMGLRAAMRVSNLPLYQEVARRIGATRMRDYVGKLGYGNGDTGKDVDQFWIDGSLLISPVGQVEFLARLARKELPLSERTQSLVHEIMRVETDGPRAIFGKTGWAVKGKPIGWFVGWATMAGRTEVFALSMDMRSAAEAPKRLAVTKALLARRDAS